MPILTLALATPLRQLFDYLPPVAMTEEEINALPSGIRVRVPFGRRQVIGWLVAINTDSEVPLAKLKPALDIIDQQPLLTGELWQLLHWVSDYYHHPLGETINTAVPAPIREGETISPATETVWQLSPAGHGLPSDGLKRAPRQAECLRYLQQHQQLSEQQLATLDISRSCLQQLQKKGLIEPFQREVKLSAQALPSDLPPPVLTGEQQQVLEQAPPLGRYSCMLLEGITGSGKTEIYLQLIQRCLDAGKQALLLIPEIGLSPQTLRRFQQRFIEPIVVLHSGLNDKERALAWQQAGRGEAAIIIGTRSAVFTPMARPGLIIIDEEHDGSYKQQDGLRYSARDVANKRAHLQQLPIIMGSATPSLESLHHALQGQYRHARLTTRATGASLPPIELLDLRGQALQQGFSQALLTAIAGQITQGNQVLVFINRRGFAPIMLCHDCGWLADCPHCDAHLTVHRQAQQLRCHHCGWQLALPKHCPQCQSPNLEHFGPGTERCETFLQQQFPQTPVWRIDRDSTRRKQAMTTMMDKINSGEPAILVGTQMLAKGHHFADVTLVAILDIDGALFSGDFRGPEKMAQLLSQVAGRAGRAKKPGRVILQSHQADSQLLQQMVDLNYHQFARLLFSDRQRLQLPPFAHLALLRCEAASLEQAEQWLQQVCQQLPAPPAAVKLVGPLPSPMVKRQQRYRAQLLLQSGNRAALHHVVKQLIGLAENQKTIRHLRWSIDIDPQELF